MCVPKFKKFSHETRLFSDPVWDRFDYPSLFIKTTRDLGQDDGTVPNRCFESPV